MKNFHAKAVDRWVDILETVGISPDILDGRHHPCPICGGTDRFRFDNKDGRGTWFCNQCDPKAGDGIKLIQKVFGLNFKEALGRIDKVLDSCPENKTPRKAQPDPRIALNQLWQNSKPVDTTDLAFNYLASRGSQIVPDNIRYYGRCYNKEINKKIPAMIAKVQNNEGRPISLHRTYLTQEGNKRIDLQSPKKLMPGTDSLHGCAIRLFLPEDNNPKTGFLGIAEGIETAIATTQLFNVATWACINSVLMEFWLPPPGYNQIVIFGDNDLNYCGQQAAYTLAKKLHHNSLRVIVKIPEKKGQDWNDVLMEK